MKLNLGFALFLVFYFVQLPAQEKSLPDLLVGEWTMSGQSMPQLNDTVSLTKKLLELNDHHPRWTFDLPDKLVQHYIYNDDKGTQAIAAANYFFKWYYDSSTALLRILDDKSDQYFKIISDNTQTIKLICVK
jgi:hypothetical protein